jgi:DNA-binding winged helix-turn-helix (wHTH) protein
MSTPVSYRFGAYRITPATREAVCGAEPLALPPRAFECVVYLLEHRDRAVGRDELIAAVWGRTEVTDNVLGQTILLARRAFDDTGKDQQVIRTVSRFGYHWTAPVELVTAAQDLPAAAAPASAPAVAEIAPQATPPPRSRRPHRAWPWLAGLALVALILVGVGMRRAHRSVAPSAPPPVHAAVALVLPVAVTSSGGPAWIRLGVMDLVAERLRAAGLAVVPSDNVVPLAGSLAAAPAPADLDRLSAATGAGLIVAPQALQAAGRWRVSLQTLAGHDPPIETTGLSPDVLAAAREAADRLAADLGHRIGDAAAPDNDTLAILLHQADAAILSTRLDEAARLLQSANPAQRATPEVQLRLARLDYRAGRLDAASRRFSDVLGQVSAESDPVLRAGALNGLGAVLGERQDYPASERRFDEAVRLLEGGNAPGMLGKSLNDRATTRGALGRYDDALADFAQARIALESVGDRLGLAVVDLNNGVLDMKRDRLAEAAPVLARAAGRFALFGVPAAELQARISAAEVAGELLDPAAAVAMNARLEQLAAAAGDPARARAARYTEASTLVAAGHIAAARALLGHLRSESVVAGDAQMLAGVQVLDAALAFDAGDAARALTDATVALKTLSAVEDERLYARAWVLLLRAARATGAADRERSAMQALSAWALEASSPAARIHLDLARAEQAAAAGEDAAARTAWERALQAADANRVPVDLVDVVQSYVAWLIRTGDLRRASAVAARIAAWSGSEYRASLVRLALYHALGRVGAWRTALAASRALAGERVIPAALQALPARLP